MEITWFGHAAFLIKAADGSRLVIDPYESGAYGGAIGYGRIDVEADVVITSHGHADHNGTKDLRGSFTLVDRVGEFKAKSFNIKTVLTSHDSSGGKERGNNLISIVEVDDLKIVHLGDLGHALSAETVHVLGKVHILLIPVGGFFTIDAREATRLMEQIAPSITIPMHYRTEKCSLPISGVEEFLKDKKNVVHLARSVLNIDKNSLPAERQIIVLLPLR
ncbi:MAG: MBL fold metallo-hydrolase [Syntrophales bacterium]|nr:MBL fold metallo-hydrolase [Syntrophales bacterium]